MKHYGHLPGIWTQLIGARIYRATNQSIPSGGSFTDLSFSHVGAL